jgi:hypothetical protein
LLGRFSFHHCGIDLKSGVLGRKNTTAMSTVNPINRILHRIFFFIEPPTYKIKMRLS